MITAANRRILWKLFINAIAVAKPPSAPSVKVHTHAVTTPQRTLRKTLLCWLVCGKKILIKEHQTLLVYIPLSMEEGGVNPDGDRKRESRGLNALKVA